MAMPVYVYVILAVGWCVWFVPFLRKWNQGEARSTNHRSRWGMLLQAIAYALLWQTYLWRWHPSHWRVGLCVALMALASWLSWTATKALGRHLRFVAAIGDDHELIRTGPYAVIRHPIYASMLAIFLGTAVIGAPAMLLVPALVIFLVGTEIRVQTEDHLLAAHFGDQFQAYRKAVSAYVPLVR